MSELALRFEPTDLANWLWLAVAALILLELTRYIAFGRRPASRPLRGGLAAAVLVALAAIRQSDRFRFDASTHSQACLALAVLTIVWVRRSYARTTRGIPDRSQRVLLALRAMAAGIVLLIAANPVLQQTTTTYERPVLGLAVDDSRSMGIRDVAGPDPKSKPFSRCEAVKAAIARVQPVLGDLAGTLEMRWFTFDTRAVPADPGALKAEGQATAVGDAIRQVRTLLSQTQRPVAGILVISDGRDTAATDDNPETAAADTAASGIPLYAVGVGSENPINRTRSLLARRIDVPDRVAARNRLPVRTEFLAVGLTGNPIEFELLLDGRTVEKRAVEPQQTADLLRIDLSCIPAAGLHQVTVRARTREIADPVEISRFVQATDDKIQVLYIDRPRYERAAVSRALGSAEDFRVTRTDLSRSGAGEQSPLPKTAEEWRRFHVILIGDIEARAFGTEELRGLGEAVRNGTGLAMLAGVRALGGGDYARTTLRDLLPVDLGITGQLQGAQTMELTPAGRSNPICQLGADPAASENRWKQLPAVAGTRQLGKLTPASETLVQTATGQPLLVVRETGPGRAAAVGFDSTWQWAFADDRGIETQQRFWRQLVMWLANRKPRCLGYHGSPGIRTRRAAGRPPACPHPRRLQGYGRTNTRLGRDHVRGYRKPRRQTRNHQARR